ncbi:MAG: rod shape-determining protein MreD [Gammaproteobacteria bacterium RIFCSPHIGHO2_12_FULL_37_34]|nr:MAG: rod shape-determining protein MreD [Gammaproteobacteria bacterium RIFCSPHIGHO2_12_FULL_37_34]
MPNWVAILITIVAALLLTILPMPAWTEWLRPAWVLLVLIYWTVTMPYLVGVGTAWLAGLVFDLLMGTVLGEHALAFTLVIYFISRLSLRLRMYSLPQQGMNILIFILFYQFIIYCIQGFLGELPNSHLYWLSSITSVVFWPWLFLLMRDFQRWFKIS